MADPPTPLEHLGILAHQQVELNPRLTHHELLTLDGLLSILWHGEPEAPGVVLCLGGALGGLLGPAGGLYHHLGERLREQGVQTLRISYRQPNDLPRCVHDAIAAAELACRNGGQRVVVVGHSFGGAVAIQLAAALPDVVVGVVTLSTQSAGCEVAAQIDERVPLLLLHGDRDELLPVDCSFVVREIAGHGEVEVLEGAGHLLAGQGPRLLDRLTRWVPASLDGPTTP